MRIRNLPFAILFIVTTITCVFLFFIRYQALKTGIMHGDIATYLNYLWNTNFWDQFLYSDQLYLTYGYPTYLVDHFAPTLMLFVPLYHLFPSPIFLIALSSMAPAVSVFFVYKISREVLHSAWFAILIAISYLLHPITLIATYDLGHGFHHDSLIPPFLFATVYFFLRYRHTQERSPLILYVCFFLLLGVKENLPVIGSVACLLLVLFDKNSRKLGIAGFALCLVFFSVGIIWLPWATEVVPQHSHRIIEDFFERGVPVVEVFELMVRSKELFLFVPLFFVPLFILPLSSEFLMYTYRDTYNFTSYYGFAPLAVLTVGYIFGTRRLMHICQTYLRPHWAHRVVLGTLIGIGLVSGTLGGYQLREIYSNVSFSPKNYFEIDFQPALDSIPRDARLSTSTILHTFLSNWDHLFRHMPEHADYVLVHLICFHYEEYDARFIQVLEHMLSKNMLSVHFVDGPMVVFKREVDSETVIQETHPLVRSKYLPLREASGFIELIHSYALEAEGKVPQAMNNLAPLIENYRPDRPFLFQRVLQRLAELKEKAS